MDTEKRIIRADAAARAQRTWGMRVAGHDWEHIASVIGYTKPTNAQRVDRIYLGSIPQPDAKEVRAAMRVRVAWLWAEAQLDVENQVPGAARTVTAVLQRWAAVEGSDAPARLQITPDAQEMEQAIALLTARAREQDEAPEADIFAIE